MVSTAATSPRDLPLDPVHYAEHVAAVAQGARVRLERDVRRADGSVVLHEGDAFGPETVGQLKGQVLLEPFHRCIRFGEPIDPNVVINVWSRVRESNDDLDRLERRTGIADDFELIARSTPIPDSVWQVATLMFERRPDWFNLAVVGGWWAVALAREAGFVEGDVMRAFAAAFTRDLGFMFIDARHIDRPGYLEGGTKAWRAVQDHVLTGSQLWFDSEELPVWSAAVGRSIYEHHERINGTGYPDRPFSEELDPVGQVVGMADLMTAVRLRRFAGSGRNVHDALPLITVSSDCFPRDVVDAAVRVLGRSGLRSTTVCDHKSKEDLLDSLLSRAYLLRRLTQMLRDLPSFEPFVPRGQPVPPPTPLTRAVSSTIQMLERSGVAQSELGIWLDSVRNGRATARMHELCEMDLQQSEAVWRVERIRRLLAEYVEDEGHRSNSSVFRVLVALQSSLTL